MNKEEIEKETKTFFVEPHSITNSEFLEKLEMQNKIDKLQEENYKLKEEIKMLRLYR